MKIKMSIYNCALWCCVFSRSRSYSRSRSRSASRSRSRSREARQSRERSASREPSQEKARSRSKSRSRSPSGGKYDDQQWDPMTSSEIRQHELICRPSGCLVTNAAFHCRNFYNHILFAVR